MEMNRMESAHSDAASDSVLRDERATRGSFHDLQSKRFYRGVSIHGLLVDHHHQVPSLASQVCPTGKGSIAESKEGDVF